MNSLSYLRSLFVAATALLSAGSSLAAVAIEKVVPFATDSEVRIQVHLKSDGREPVQVSGAIESANNISTETSPSGILWQGDLGTSGVTTGVASLETTVTNLRPQLWCPGSPALYNLTVTALQAGDEPTSHTVRFGFRSVAAKDGQILLNGKPIFLRGIAINPPMRDIPDEVGYSRKFAYDYVSYLRSQNVNMIRLTFDFVPEERQQAWFDVCDELGMMLYQGNYGSPPGATKKGPAFDPEEQTAAFQGNNPNAPPTGKNAPPDSFEQTVQFYKDVFETYARHPSVVIYILSNELPGPVGSNPQWHDFLTRVDARINEWDPTRLVIGNAGYGLGREGDINDIHRYWGWYYNSFLTYYNLRDTVGLFGESTDKQPFTFSECVGSFTSPHGPFNIVFKKQLAPQLGWTGHSENQRDDALAYQSFMIKHALESFRTMREQNHRIAGIMPFTILFFNWEAIRSFAEMKPKPAMEQMGISYSPILPSIELWTPQVYAGTSIRPIVHVVNDSDSFSALTGARLKLQLIAADKIVMSEQSLEVPAIEYFAARTFSMPMQIPGEAAGDCMLLAIIEQNGRSISQNNDSIFIAPKQVPPPPDSNSVKPMLFDPTGRTVNALKKLGLGFQRIENLEPASLASAKFLLIGEESVPAAAPLPQLNDFIKGGGRILCLAQDGQNFDPSWLPVKIEMLSGTATDPTYTPQIRPTADQQNINSERPWHPIFKGIGRKRLRLWSDYTDWDQSKPGFPQVYPVTHGFKVLDQDELDRIAVLANYDRGLEGIAVAEMFEGSGSVIFTGLDLIKRIGLDPIADQMLSNLVNYLTIPDHEVLPLIEKPIVWGSYSTERGVLTGPIHGLIYNCRWVPPATAPDATPWPDNSGAWNTHPGNPFIAIGIRPFGPYTWSKGAAPRESSKDPIGTGIFHCRVPEGRQCVVTKVQNVTSETKSLAVDINRCPATPVEVMPGKTIDIKTAIPSGETNVSVRYTGHKQLVILETAFE